MRIVLVFFVALVFVSGCTTTDQYKNAQGSAQSVAILKGGEDRKALATWTYFVVEAIDEKTVSFFQTGTAHQFKLTPGPHKILATAVFNTGWGGLCPCESRLVVTANFQSGRTYRLNGEIKDNRMLVWIEDAATSQRVSDIASEAYVSRPR